MTEVEIKTETGKTSETMAKTAENKRKTEAKRSLPENEIRLRLPAIPENEGVARAVVGAVIARLDPTVEELADLRCAVSEAVTNAVVHAYGRDGGTVYLTIALWQGRRVTVEVRDTGRGIENVEEAMRPAYTTDKTGERSGMGFAVMQSFCDGVRVRSAVGRGTRVLLTKNLSPRLSEQ